MLSQLQSLKFSFKQLNGIFLVFGMVLPFMIVSTIPLFHHKDVSTFSQWADCWQRDSEHIYENCKNAIFTPNYPYLGMALSAGVISEIKSFFRTNDIHSVAKYFRLFLAIFDAFNFLLLIGIARSLGLKYSVPIALLVALLPSTWSGGALWGQIDGISQFFLLAAVFALISAVQTAGHGKKAASTTCFAAALVALVGCLLTKQLTIFSVFALIPLLIFSFAKIAAASKIQRLTALGSLIGALGLFLVLDRRLSVPGYLGSSYLYVWLGGESRQHEMISGRISGNGFNIWMFLERDMMSASNEPFYCHPIFEQSMCLTPRGVGRTLYFGYVSLIGYLFFLLSRRLHHFGDNGEKQTRFILAASILFLVQINLGFNVLLTGTHERYLYHFYPFLMIVAIFYLPYRSLLNWRHFLFFIACAIVYGMFVLSILSPMPGDWPFSGKHRFVAAIHLILLGILTAFSVKLLKFLPNRQQTKPWWKS
ncbi:MAG: hypothetical protein C5B49_14745 [Bdellovibrio sp.]|nr:MAG: hypothetical protein C5B49_14745 [Bdellovibrio sp.]